MFSQVTYRPDTTSGGSHGTTAEQQNMELMKTLDDAWNGEDRLGGAP
jgi:hypothetical protein